MAVIYPLEFHRRSERQWRHRVKASTRSGDDKASTIRGNECCPNCCLPAAKPFVSRYLPGSVVEHLWECKTCEFICTTPFHPLLVYERRAPVRYTSPKTLHSALPINP